MLESLEILAARHESEETDTFPNVVQNDSIEVLAKELPTIFIPRTMDADFF